MSSEFGNQIRIQLFGQSHGAGIGVVIDGLPAGESLDLEQIGAFLARRAPGGALATARRESDVPKILSGFENGVTCGAPLCAVFENRDTRSGDYDKLRAIPRPAHADFPAFVKTGGSSDHRGGGHFSARLTAPLVFAGAVASQLLERRGIFIGAHICEIAGIADTPFDPVGIDRGTLAMLKARSPAVLDCEAGARMIRAVTEARSAGDSVGGTVECAAIGLPAGLGAPIFGGIENRIASAVFGVPAVKGLEFGAGFAAARLRGSENNDPFYWDGDTVRTRTNRHGGVLGGLASGMPLVFRAAFKPTPSIAREQDSVDLIQKTDVKLCIEGRHDPCVVLRAVPCIEAACAVALLDLMAADSKL